MTLFDGNAEEYRLFDRMRLRFLKITRLMNAAEAATGNEYFKRVLCPHFEWQKAGDRQARVYTIKR